MQSFCASSGKVYTGSDSMFLEFDPKKNEFTHYAHIENVDICAFTLEEDKSGNILFGSYSELGCRLFSNNPYARKYVTLD